MSENVKFKVGDKVRQKTNVKYVDTCLVSHWKHHWSREEPTDGTFFIISEADSIGDVRYNTNPNKTYGPSVPSEWLELVKPAEPEITEGSLWVHHISGQIAKVIMFNDDGRVVLEAHNTTEHYEEGALFVYTPEMKPFVEAYKTYIEKPKTLKIERFVCVEQYIPDGSIDIDSTIYVSEEEAREKWVNFFDYYRLLDVIKIEWEGKVE